MSCPCDQKNYPAALDIHAGLDQLPRALGTFPQWRLAILDAIGRQNALSHWRARDADDFGMLLVEMGAYLFDVLSFYDALLCNDSYLNTAWLEGTERKLVSLLGYIPRPAIASQAWLAIEADGRRLVELPAKTAFRSGEFNGNPPQVFELEENAWVDPRLNKHTVARVLSDSISGGSLNSILVTPNSLRIQKGSPVVLSFNGTLRTAYVDNIKAVALRSRKPASEIIFKTEISVPAGAKYSELRVFTLGNSMPLWRASNPFSGTKVLLDTRAPVRAGEFVLFEKEGSLKVRTVNVSDTSSQTILSAVTTTVKNLDGDITAELESPDVKTSVSELTLSSSLGWSGADRNKVTLYYGVSDAARVLIPERDDLQQGDPLSIPTYVDEARVPVNNLLLEDTHLEGLFTTGSLNAETQTASLDAETAWSQSLQSPVSLYANVLKISRGETVANELLGIGDATQQWQTFELKNKCLTYLPADNATGNKSTLKVYVGGVLWQEVSTFFGVQSDEQVYLVRHDDAGTAQIQFGGGARLPSGTAVYANYRFGAGAAVPPAGSINQMAEPVNGIKTIKNVLAAFGGNDAESAADLKHYAPQSALLLGRAVSLVDLEAAAHGVAGVEAVKGVFRWDKKRQEKRAVIYFIGDAQLTSGLLASLLTISEPDALIDVKPALAQSASVNLELEIDKRYQSSDVIADVQQALYRSPQPSVAGGVLHKTSLGPEGVIFYSHIIDAIMDVPGVRGINNMSFNGSAISGYGIKPAAEHYFDFGELGTNTSGITINGVI